MEHVTAPEAEPTLCRALYARQPVRVFLGESEKGVVGLAAEPYEGMSVIFKEPPAEGRGVVVCVDYAVRESSKGNYYIKCFRYVPEERLAYVKAACRDTLLSRLAEHVRGLLPPALAGHAESFVRGIVPEEAADKVLLFAYDGELPDPSFVLVDAEGTVWSFGPRGYVGRIVYVNPHYMTMSDSPPEFLPGVIDLVDKVGVYLVPRRHKWLLDALEKAKNMPVSWELRDRVYSRLLDLLRARVAGSGEAAP